MLPTLFSSSTYSPRPPLLVGLILMHSGRDAGLGGMGFTPASQGGTHIVERNLTRLTVVIAVLFFANTVALYRLLK